MWNSRVAMVEKPIKEGTLIGVGLRKVFQTLAVVFPEG
jgi:hypothetical protein